MHERHPKLNREDLNTFPLETRRHLLNADAIRPLCPTSDMAPGLECIGHRLREARNKGAARVFMFGAHVIRAGVQRYVMDMMEKGLISNLALNGAGVIHDFEFAKIGATTECVATYIKDGRFGMWTELARINEVVSQAACEGLGLGEAVGREIELNKYPHRHISLLAAAYRLGIPATVHVGIGYDIVYQLPNCDGAAYGAASYTDFLRFAELLRHLTEGVVMCFGSAVMGPEIFLKALSMARNIVHQQGGAIDNFDTLVCDLAPIPEKRPAAPHRDDPLYYFRPWKTLLSRTLSGRGTGHYVRLDHAASIPQLWTAAVQHGGKAEHTAGDNPSPQSQLELQWT